MELKMPTKKQVLEAFYEIEQGNYEMALEKMWPQAFEDDKSVNINDGMKIVTSDKSTTLVWVTTGGKEIVFNPNFDWEFVDKDEAGYPTAIPTRKENKEEKSERDRRKE